MLQLLVKLWESSKGNESLPLFTLTLVASFFRFYSITTLKLVFCVSIKTFTDILDDKEKGIDDCKVYVNDRTRGNYLDKVGGTGGMGKGSFGSYKDGVFEKWTRITDFRRERSTGTPNEGVR